MHPGSPDQISNLGPCYQIQYSVIYSVRIVSIVFRRPLILGNSPLNSQRCRNQLPVLLFGSFGDANMSLYDRHLSLVSLLLLLLASASVDSSLKV